jgi:hypothetical protein
MVKMGEIASELPQSERALAGVTQAPLFGGFPRP